MIKKLRVKFIAVIMAIVTVMLLAIFGFVLRNTYLSLRQESMEAIREYTMEPAHPGHRPGDLPGSHMPMFTVKKGPGGVLMATGSAYFDLTDETLVRQIYDAAAETGERTEILLQWKLRFYRMDGPGENGYVFMDISTQQQMMQDLLGTCSLLFILAIILFFLISLWLSKWIIRPVEQAGQQQRQFVADASHELKTPLTVILTNAELLSSQEYDDVAKARFSRSILSMSRQMRGLLEGLLDLARMDNGKAAFSQERVELSVLAEDCCLGFEPVYFEAGRTLCAAVEPGLCLRGSESHLRQVIDILLDNGCKYSEPGSTVELTLKAQGRGKCLLTVFSRGTPLTKEQCRDIFKRFYRVDEARAMNRSYGLGLSIAESIVSRHGGRIWAAGEPEGNRFSVTLPIL